MKTRTAIALVLASFATTACATSDDIHGGTGRKLDVDNRGDIVQGRLTEENISIDFRFEKSGDRTDISIETRDGFKLVESYKGSATLLETFHTNGARFSADAMRDLAEMHELTLVRHLPEVLAAQGIDIGSAVRSPALDQVFCPTRALADAELQTDNLDLDRN